METKVEELIKADLKELSKDYSKEDVAKAEVLMKKIVEQGMAPKDAMGLSNTFLEAAYEAASNFFKSGKFKKAEGMYRILMQLDPLQPRFPMALAAALHRQHKYFEALQYYGLTSKLNEADPLPYFHASDCLAKLKLLPEACVMLKVMLGKVGNDPKYKLLKTSSEEVLHSLESQMKYVPEKAHFSQVTPVDLRNEEDV